MPEKQGARVCIELSCEKQRAAIWLAYPFSRLLTQHNQEIAQLLPDPFPRERVGSGDETTVEGAWCEATRVLFCSPTLLCSSHIIFGKGRRKRKRLIGIPKKFVYCTPPLMIT